MNLKFLVNDKPMDEVILEYLQSRKGNIVSIGELNSHCAAPITDNPVSSLEDNYLFFLSVVQTVRNLKEKGLVETKNIEHHLWVKLTGE